MSNLTHKAETRTARPWAGSPSGIVALNRIPSRCVGLYIRNHANASFRHCGGYPMTRTPFSAAALMSSVVPIGVALFGTVPHADARVMQVVIAATEQPTYGGKSFGTVGPYERISGQIVGE